MKKKKNIVSLADHANNGTMRTPRQALEDATSEFDPGGRLEGFNKILILPLRDNNDGYDTAFYQAGMSMSQCIALCEVAKTMFLEHMDLSS